MKDIFNVDKLAQDSANDFMNRKKLLQQKIENGTATAKDKKDLKELNEFLEMLEEL